MKRYQKLIVSVFIVCLLAFNLSPVLAQNQTSQNTTPGNTQAVQQASGNTANTGNNNSQTENKQKSSDKSKKSSNGWNPWADFKSWLGTTLAVDLARAVASLTYLFIEGINRLGLAVASLFLDNSLAWSKQILVIPTVTTGWKIVRDLVNLLFVVFIIVIAFATILRIESYGIKQALAKLIIVALLINFSFLFCKVIIEFSNYLSDYFMHNATSGVGSLSGTLANSTQIQKLVTAEKNPAMVMAKSGLSVIINLLLMRWFVLIYSIVFLLLILVLVILFYLRIFALAILVVLAPLAWICIVFPDIKKFYNDWWNQFLKWSFFAPISLFFIYLAILSNNAVTKITTGFAENAFIASGGIAFENVLGLTSTSPIAMVFHLFFTLGMIFTGLVVAWQLSIAGSKATQGIAKWGWNKAMGGMKGGSLWATRQYTTRGPFGRAVESMRNWGAGPGQGRVARAISALFRRAGDWLRNKGLTAQGVIAQQLSQATKEIKDIPLEELIPAYNRIEQNPGRRLAIIKKAVKEGRADKLPEMAQIEADKLYKSAGLENANELWKVMPTWNPEVYNNLQNRNFAEASTSLSENMRKMSKWDKVKFGAIIDGKDNIKGRLSQLEWDENVLPILAKSIVKDEKAGAKIGKMVEELNTDQIKKLGKHLNTPGNVEAIKKNYSLLSWFRDTPGKRALGEIAKKLEAKEEILKGKPKIIAANKYTKP